jgi:hypothetical protein
MYGVRASYFLLTSTTVALNVFQITALFTQHKVRSFIAVGIPTRSN